MLKVLQQVLGVLFFAVMAAELESTGPGRGAEKKAAAISKLTAVADQFVPEWLDGVLPIVAGMLIDALVFWLNRTGFFGQLSAGSEPSPSKP